MSYFIDKSSYPTLFNQPQFRILSATDIGPSGSYITFSDAAFQGYFGCSNGNPSVGPFYGQVQDVSTCIIAQNEVSSLVSQITSFVSSGTTPFATGISGGFFPNTIYSILGDLSLSDITLTFVGINSTDQFFIYIINGSLTFDENVSYSLQGALAENIFWLSGSNINFGLSIATADGVFIANNSITFDGVTTISGNLFAQTGSITFNGTTSESQTFIICYLKGSKILTENGYKVVEELNEGDLVVSKGKIMNNESYELEEKSLLEPIKWIGKFNIKDFNSQSFPICIQANALGDNLPLEDLYVSPGHRILLDGKMICARDLVNGNTIYQDINNHDIEYYHFELPEHSSVIANGVLTESYLDLNTKNVFDK